MAKGSLPAEAVFVGEAPGMSEDALGEPFVSTAPAGQLLEWIIGQGLPQGTACAMTNLVACFPREAKSRGDNQPEYSEIMACRPRLVEFLNMARPKLVVCVGVTLAEYVPHNKTVGRVEIVHPASIKRMPLVQQRYAAMKCAVQIRSAYAEAVKSIQQFQPWEVDHAEGKKGRRRVADIYDEAEQDIPF